MMEQKWKSHFPKAFKLIHTWYEETQPECSMLYYALTQGYVNSEEYLNWARNELGIASLSERYFTEKMDFNAFKKFQHEYKWTPDCLPIMEWDGVVFVACVTPDSLPKEFRWQLQPLLADVNSLRSTWEKIQNSINNNKSIEIHEPSISSESTAKPEFEMKVDVDNPSATHQPIGEFSLEAIKIKPEINFDGNFPDLESSIKVKEENAEASEHSNPAMELPEGFSSSDAKSDHPPLKTGDELSFFSEASISVVATPPLAPSENTVSVVHPIAESSEISESAEEPVKHSEKHFDSSKVVSTEVQISSENKGNINSSLFTECFNEAHQMYSKTLIFKVVNNSAEAIAWDSATQKQGDAKPIPLDQAGFFKIAFKTQKPYHGYTVANDANDSFSKVWNAGQTPEHLTIIPLLKNGEGVFGFFVGLADKNIEKRESLNLMMNISQKITSQIQSFDEAAKAA